MKHWVVKGNPKWCYWVIELDPGCVNDPGNSHGPWSSKREHFILIVG
jgi:hypothetical protein